MNNKLSLIKKLIFTTLSIFIAITGIIVGDSKTVGADEGKSVLYSINEKLLINEEIKLVTEFQNSEENNKLTIISPKGFEIDEKKIKEENKSLILDLSIDKKDDINNKIIFLLKDQKYSGKLLINGRFSTPGNYEFIRDYDGSKDICLLKIVEENKLEEQTIESSSQTDASNRTNEEEAVEEERKVTDSIDLGSIINSSEDKKVLSSSNKMESRFDDNFPAPQITKEYSNVKHQDYEKDGKNHWGNTLQFTLKIGNGKYAWIDWEDVSVQEYIPKDLKVDKNSITLTDNSTGLSRKIPLALNENSNILSQYFPLIKKDSSYTIKYQARILSRTGITLTSITKANGGNGKIERNLDIPINKDSFNAPTLHMDVFHSDGKMVDNINRAKRGEQVKYKLIIEKYFKNKANDQGYSFVKLESDPIDKNLENLENFVLKTESGTELKNAKIDFDLSKRIVTVTLDNLKNFSANQDLILEYDAKIKDDALDGMKVSSGYWSQAIFATDNICKRQHQDISMLLNIGDLKFVSAPTKLNYGDDLKMSVIDRVYFPKEINQDLLVNDSRYDGQIHKWRMVVKLGNELTSSNGHKLLNSFFYRQNKNGQINDKALSMKESQVIVEHTTTNDDSEVNISKNWITNREGPILKVKSGAAYAEEYLGSFEWTLQDVPNNMD